MEENELGVNDRENRSGQRKVCGSESCLKCDKELRENRADRGRLTQQTLTAALLHSSPPPYLLITTEERDRQTEGGSESYAGLIGCRALDFLCLVSFCFGLNAQTLLLIFHVEKGPVIREVDLQKEDKLLTHIHTDGGRDVDFVPCSRVCVYIANWLESRAETDFWFLL